VGQDSILLADFQSACFGPSLQLEEGRLKIGQQDEILPHQCCSC